MSGREYYFGKKQNEPKFEEFEGWVFETEEIEEGF